MEAGRSPRDSLSRFGISMAVTEVFVMKMQRSSQISNMFGGRTHLLIITVILLKKLSGGLITQMNKIYWETDMEGKIRNSILALVSPLKMENNF